MIVEILEFVDRLDAPLMSVAAEDRPFDHCICDA